MKEIDILKFIKNLLSSKVQIWIEKLDRYGESEIESSQSRKRRESIMRQ